MGGDGIPLADVHLVVGTRGPPLRLDPVRDAGELETALPPAECRPLTVADEHYRARLLVHRRRLHRHLRSGVWLAVLLARASEGRKQNPAIARRFPRW